MYSKIVLKEGKLEYHFNENEMPCAEDFYVNDVFPNATKRLEYSVELNLWLANTKVYKIRSSDEALFRKELFDLTKHGGTLHFEKALEQGIHIDPTHIEIKKEECTGNCEKDIVWEGRHGSCKDTCEAPTVFAVLKPQEIKSSDKQYPLSFINWLHGMSSPNYTERMYQKYLKEHPQQ